MSRSCTVSTVEMCWSSAPDFARQLAPNAFQPSSSACFCVALSGAWLSCIS